MQANMLDDIQSVLLLGPGPSGVAPATYQALSRPSLGHLDPYFFQIMDQVKAGLRQLMGTANHLTAPVSGSRALSSWSTPMMSPSWFFMGSTSMEVER